MSPVSSATLKMEINAKEKKASSSNSFTTLCGEGWRESQLLAAWCTQQWMMKRRHFSHRFNLTQKKNSYPAPIHDQPKKRCDSEVSYWHRISTEIARVLLFAQAIASPESWSWSDIICTPNCSTFCSKENSFYSFKTQKYFSLCILYYLWISVTFTFIPIICLQIIWWILGRFWNTTNLFFLFW